MHLKIEFDVLVKYRNFWNLAREFLNAPNCQINLYPRDLWFTKENYLIDFKIYFEFISI
jgi:hypothetical protein